MSTRRTIAVTVFTLGFAYACEGPDGPSDTATRRLPTQDAGDAQTFNFVDGFADAALQQGPKSDILPTFLPLVGAKKAPPPISGGTLIVSRDGLFAFAADSDRDRVSIVDLKKHLLLFSTPLQPGDEPGRLVEDGSGRIHVALRSGGALVTIDETTGVVLARRPVCPAPRGVAWDSSTDLVWVACATGELVAFPSAGGPPTKSFVVERDLRDVIATNGSLSISKFRSAEILRLASDGSIARRDTQPTAQSFAAHVAWRTTSDPSGNLVVVHQLEKIGAITTQVQGGYGGGCGPPIPPDANLPVADGGANVGCGPDHLANFSFAKCDEQPGAIVSAVTVLANDGSVVTSRAFPASLPVDVAVSRDGSLFGVVAAGDAFVKGLASVFLLDACGDVARTPVTVGQTYSEQAIAVAFDASNNMLVQTREPAELWSFDAMTGTPSLIPLSSITRDDTGHDVFHTQAGSMIACAGCHPEGQDDGHVWMLDGEPRRTPSLRGTIQGTAPYHWPGDQPDLDALVDDVYSKRMNGAPLTSDVKSVLQAWVEGIPAPPAPSWVDASAALRGKSIFEDVNVGCSGCHSGAKFTNNQTMFVGTGGRMWTAFQAPPLIGVGWRAPFLHDGCAATLADRFGSCATPQHGSIGALTPSNITDLIAYLETL